MARAARQSRACLIVTGVVIIWPLHAILSGCRGEENEAQSVVSEQAPIEGKPPHSSTAGASTQPVAVDDRDAADSPPALPKSASVGDWIKVRPVRVAAGTDWWKRLGDHARADRLAPFRVERLARCAYQRRGDPRQRVAEAELFEARSPEDAIGMFLVECPGPDTELGRGPIGIIRTRRDGTRRHWHAWQGYHYIHLWMDGAADDREAIRAAERLLGRILLSTSGTELPRLLTLLPAEGRRAGQVWLVRSVRSLTGPAGPRLSWPEPAAADALLGLGDGTLLALGAFETPDGKEPNYVFVIQYASAGEARAAYQRGSSGHAGIGPPCLLTDPMGPFLAGSWTPEQESLAHTLQEVKRALTAHRPATQ